MPWYWLGMLILVIQLFLTGFRSPRKLKKMWELDYINFCVVFEVVIMIFTYSWRVVPSIYLVVRILKNTDWYSENYSPCESCDPLGS